MEYLHARSVFWELYGCANLDSQWCYRGFGALHECVSAMLYFRQPLEAREGEGRGASGPWANFSPYKQGLSIISLLSYSDSILFVCFALNRLEKMEPLRNLPQSQRVAVTTTCDRIRWLLQDEIVSELRHIGPVTVQMLEKVQAHVEQSEDHSTCISRSVPLQFVFGAEQSMELFVKEFEKISLVKYHLNSVGYYYYLAGTYQKPETPEVVASPVEISVGDTMVKLQEEDSEVSKLMEGMADSEQDVESTADNADEVATNAIAVDVETGEQEVPSLSKITFQTSEDELKADEGDDETTVIPPVRTSARSEEENSSSLSGDLYVDSVPDTSLCDSSLTSAKSEEENSGHPPVIIIPTFSLTKQTSEEDPATPHATTPIKVVPVTDSTPPGTLPVIVTDTSKATKKRGGSDNSTLSPQTPEKPRHRSECLPFWLFMRIFDNQVDIFFHRR